MNAGLIKAIVILPGTALVYVPAIILYFTRNGPNAASFPPDSMIKILAGLLIAAVGLFLMAWAMRLFTTKGGGGTPAPWQPIHNLIILGPYRHTRNPMLSGVLLFLVAESTLLWSVPLFVWAAAFFVLNTVYFRFVEEPELEKRYGTAYSHFKQNVPRWLPRLTPYEDDEQE